MSPMVGGWTRLAYRMCGESGQREAWKVEWRSVLCDEGVCRKRQESMSRTLEGGHVVTLYVNGKRWVSTGFEGGSPVRPRLRAAAG